MPQTGRRQMRNLNIPITIKEMEFSSLSSYKEHTAPRPSHASRNRCFYSHTKLSESIFVKSTWKTWKCCYQNEGQRREGNPRLTSSRNVDAETLKTHSPKAAPRSKQIIGGDWAGFMPESKHREQIHLFPHQQPKGKKYVQLNTEEAFT